MRIYSYKLLIFPMLARVLPKPRVVHIGRVWLGWSLQPHLSFWPSPISTSKKLALSLSMLRITVLTCNGYTMVTRIYCGKPPDPKGAAQGRCVVFCDKSMVTVV